MADRDDEAEATDAKAGAPATEVGEEQASDGFLNTLRQAVARGWLTPLNENKPMDVELAEAIVASVKESWDEIEQGRRGDVERVDTSSQVGHAPKEAQVAELIYEAARLEAAWSGRSIVPEEWQRRDDKFREQMVRTVANYLAMDQLPSPEEAHDNWMREHIRMGWKYGEKRDPELKLHPDLVPYDELPKDERDKDAVFLALVWLARQLVQPLGGGQA
jgi:hypothetical protein